MKKRPKLSRAILLRSARLAVASSTVRGSGIPGLVDEIREALSRVRLSSFRTTSRREFRRALDRWTLWIEAAVPKRHCPWGLSRKCLNIFLRDCYYNSFLQSQFGSKVSGDWFEVPLDSITGGRLHKEHPGIAPRWKTVRDLDPESSDRFQEAARELAASWGIARVHLDTYLWVQR